VLIEAPILFVAPKPFQVPLGFGTAMGEALSGRLLLGFAPFGPFSGDTEVNDGGHGS
jgi:hypothetical protein